MAKKKVSVANMSPATKPHICFERIRPDAIDQERMVRRALRGAMMSNEGATLNPEEVAHRTRMALIESRKWTTGDAIRCRFLHGSIAVEKKVEAIAHLWEKYANIKFKFVKTGDAEIRIAFADDGSWSAVGRDVLNEQYFPKHQPTMYYGWLDNSTAATAYQRGVLHEFGRAFGCVHEHQQTKFDRKWHKTNVPEYFSGSLNYWYEKDIKHNVLQKHSPTGISSTDYAPDSIMLYVFDADHFTDEKGPTNDNKKLSAEDIAFNKKLFPS